MKLSKAIFSWPSNIGAWWKFAWLVQAARCLFWWSSREAIQRPSFPVLLQEMSTSVFCSVKGQSRSAVASKFVWVSALLASTPKTSLSMTPWIRLLKRCRGVCRAGSKLVSVDCRFRCCFARGWVDASLEEEFVLRTERASAMPHKIRSRKRVEPPFNRTVQ